MALVPNSKNALKATSLISYVSVAEFSSHFFNYYTTLEGLQTIGHLDPVKLSLYCSAVSATRSCLWHCHSPTALCRSPGFAAESEEGKVRNSTSMH